MVLGRNNHSYPLPLANINPNEPNLVWWWTVRALANNLLQPRTQALTFICHNVLLDTFKIAYYFWLYKFQNKKGTQDLNCSIDHETNSIGGMKPLTKSETMFVSPQRKHDSCHKLWQNWSNYQNFKHYTLNWWYKSGALIILRVSAEF